MEQEVIVSTHGKRPASPYHKSQARKVTSEYFDNTVLFSDA
jgi:hypothetical protein